MLHAPLARGLDTCHLVDGDGFVGCPRVGHDVDVARCLSCSELLLAVRDRTGVVREVRCTPPPRDVRSPWDLLGPC
jgi:hypothetical protein